MTEKRFWLVSVEYDGEQRFVRDNNLIGEKSMSNQEVVDTLNKFQELSINDLKQIEQLKKENEQLKSDKEHLMGCLIRFFGYDDEDIDYNLNRESNREYGKQYYSMKEETKKELKE